MKPHIYFATPTRDWKVDAAFCDARTATIEHIIKLGWSYSRMLGPPGAGDIFVARAALEDLFFKSKADYLFFLDSDLAWEPESVERIVRYERPFVGAYYVPREHDWTAADKAAARGMDTHEASAALRPNLAMYPVDGEPGKLAPRFEEEGRLVEAAYLPGGFLCLRRDVLEQMRAHYADDWQTYRGKRTHRLFEVMLTEDKRERCADDVGFCRRYRAIGGTIWCDTQASFAHIGPCEYVSPSLASAFNRIAAAQGAR